MQAASVPFKEGVSSPSCFRLIWRLVIVAVIAWGLFLNFYGAFGSFQSWVFLYYTSLSNIAVMLLFGVLCCTDAAALLKDRRDLSNGARLGKVKTALTWAILVTGLVWHLVLVPVAGSRIQDPQTVAYFLPLLDTVNAGNLLLSMIFLHSYAPLLVFLDWLFFDRKGTLSPAVPLSWLLIPAGYFAFICAWVYGVGPVNSTYQLTFPYSVIDFTAHPAIEVWRNVGLMAAGMLVLAYLFWALDRMLGQKSRPQV